jgi:hypothetical protein
LEVEAPHATILENWVDVAFSEPHQQDAFVDFDSLHPRKDHLVYEEVAGPLLGYNLMAEAAEGHAILAD